MVHTLCDGTKTNVLEGEYKSLGVIEKFNVKFDYSDVEILDFEKEEDHINVKMKQKDKANPRDGLIWKEKYFADHNNHYELRLIVSFNKRGEEKQMRIVIIFLEKFEDEIIIRNSIKKHDHIPFSGGFLVLGIATKTVQLKVPCIL